MPTPRARRAARDDERRLIGAVAVSSLGTWSYNVGIAVFAYEETQSAAWVAAATVGRYVPALVITAIGSRWADRRPRREVAIVSDLVCAALMVGLTLVALNHGSLVVAIGLAALSSGISRVQSAAAMAMTGDVVPESRLARTSATLSTTESIATALGPALASVVLALSSPAALFAINAVSFLASAALVLGIRSSAGRGALDSDGSSGSSATVRRTLALVWPLVVARSVAGVVYGADVVLLAIIATAQLRQGTSGYGWLLAAAGAGGLAAAVWLRRDTRNRRTAVTVPVAMAVYALPLLLFSFAPALAPSLLVQLVRGAGLVVVSACLLAALQSSLPSSVAGRLFGINHVALLLGTSIGAVLAPLSLSRYGLDVTLALFAAVPTAVTLFLAPWLHSFDVRRASVLAALEPRVSLLRHLDLFDEASRATLYAVAEGARTVAFAPGTLVLRQGDRSEALYIVVDGSLDVYVDDGDGPLHVRSLAAPTYVGEIGLVHGRPRSASVVAADPVVAWEVPAAVFLSAAASAGLSGALDEGIQVRLGGGRWGIDAPERSPSA